MSATFRFRLQVEVEPSSTRSGVNNLRVLVRQPVAVATLPPTLLAGRAIYQAGTEGALATTYFTNITSTRLQRTRPPIPVDLASLASLKSLLLL
jgi:hypothetical protein